MSKISVAIFNINKVVWKEFPWISSINVCVVQDTNEPVELPILCVKKFVYQIEEPMDWI